MLRNISIVASFAALLTLSTTQLVAQGTTHPIGVSGSGGSITLSTTPASTLVVNLEIDVERVIVGKYARYAQEYLGVRAPLVAKERATIVSANVSLAPSDFYLASAEMLTFSGSEQISSVAESLPIDLASLDGLSVEEAAEEAAAAITKLRSMRRDILSGELGEGFYSGGLGAALERIAYEENQYAELFLGRTVITRERVTRYVTLSGEDTRYIVCRFSPTEGVVDSSNLKAEPILLQLTASEQEIPEPPLIDAKSRSVTFRVSNIVKCDLYRNASLIASKSMPLPEFGYDLIVQDK